MGKFSEQFFTLPDGKTLPQLVRFRDSGIPIIDVGENRYIFGRTFDSEARSLLESLAVINADYFNSKNISDGFPLIMNFYSGNAHRHIKNKHVNVLNENSKHFLTESLRTFICSKLATIDRDGPVNLIEYISKVVIDYNLKLFFNYNSTLAELNALYNFKDMYTMGLYLTGDQRDIYYCSEQLVDHLKFFQGFASQFRSSNKNGRQDWVSFFYLLSIAGSTNIAKAVSYILLLVYENELFSKVFKDESKKNERDAVIVHELLRFLPLVHNQVISPFITRKVSSGHKYASNFSGIEFVHFMPTLSHVDPKVFKDPLKFCLSRNVKGDVRLASFGIGGHSCCGANIVTNWLQAWVSALRVQTPTLIDGSLHYTPFTERVKHVERMTFWVKFEG